MALFLAGLVALVALIAGCGGGGGDNTTTTAATTTAPAAAAGGGGPARAGVYVGTVGGTNHLIAMVTDGGRASAGPTCASRKERRSG